MSFSLWRQFNPAAADAWLSEATFLLHGLSGLQTLAKEEGYKRHRVFVDWIQALIDQGYGIEYLD